MIKFSKFALAAAIVSMLATPAMAQQKTRSFKEYFDGQCQFITQVLVPGGSITVLDSAGNPSRQNIWTWKNIRYESCVAKPKPRASKDTPPKGMTARQELAWMSRNEDPGAGMSW